MDQPKTHQFVPKRGSVCKLDAMHTKGHCCLHVRSAVIDVNSKGWVDCKILQEQFENARIRFQQFRFARKHNSREPLQELETLQSGRESLNRPVAERI